ncbi:MAG: TonB-dependent receptor [Prevotella sp.]|nr:TonB-dependent receptor [Prevotella sp.]
MLRRFFLGTLCVLATVYISAQTKVDKQVNLDEVVVTGTGTEHTLKNAPVQTEVISAKTLRNFAGKSIEEILGMLTSSFDFNEGDMGSKIQMNGLGNSYILILIDGKRIHGDNGGENDLSLIDPLNIEKIEVVKGAASALYGSDAIAGVINIITKNRHTEGLLLENSTRVGSYGDVRQHNGIGFSIGKVNSYTNLQVQHSDGWQNTSTEAPNQTEYLITDSKNKTTNRYTNWQIAERLFYQPTKDLELYAEGTLYRKRIYRPQGIHPGVDIHWYDLRYNNASLAGGGKWNLNKQDYLTLDVMWNRHAYYYDFTAEYLTDGYKEDGTFTHYYPYYPGDEQLQADQQRTLAELKGVFTLPYDNRFSAGIEGRYDWLRAPMRVVDEQKDDYTGALYVQDEFNGIPNLNITAGLRLNINKQFGTRLTPKISAMYKAGQRVRLRATWAQGFKTPTLKEIYYRYIRQMNGTYLYLGNTDLDPQSSNYYSAGIEYTWNGLSITATGYYNKVDKMITLVTIPNNEAPAEYIIQYDPIKTRQYKNMENAETYGVDVNIRYNYKAFSFGGGYSYLDTQAQVYDTEKDRLMDVVIDGMANHKGNVFANWGHDFTSKYHLGVGIYGKMSTKRYYQIDGDGKGSQIWRVSTTHDFAGNKHLSYRLEAGVDNIFNYVDRTPHGLHLGTTTPGTTIYATFTIRFKDGKHNINNKFKTNLNERSYEEN